MCTNLLLLLILLKKTSVCCKLIDLKDLNLRRFPESQTRLRITQALTRTLFRSDGHSLHCDYLYRLLSQDADVKESLVLIKLLLTRPVLEDEEIKWLTENAGSNSLINTIWVILLSKSEISQDLLRNLVLEHKDSIQKEEIEEDLIKELLDQGMFIKMVSTPLYSSIINYIMNADSCVVDASNTYTIQWAAAELIKANYLAEAGNLQLLSTGVPSVLRGFSQAVLYCNKMPQQ